MTAAAQNKEKVRTLSFFLKPGERDPDPRRVSISIGKYNLILIDLFC